MATTTNEPPPRRPIVADVSAMASATNIDRRQCKRVVPMKVLGLGASRTGTSSLRQALLDLGYNDVYHFASILNENPRDAEMWNAAIDAKFFSEGTPFTRDDWDQLLGHCMAAVDTPCIMFYKELLAAYPEAKVIVTIRDSPQQWWQSQMNTIVKHLKENALREPSVFVKPFLPPESPVSAMFRKIGQAGPMYRALLSDAENGTRLGIGWHEKYLEEIRALVPKERLLVMNVKQGWSPLSAFLGHEVPAWEFPNVNSTSEFQKNGEDFKRVFGRIILWNMVKSLGIVMAVGVAGFAWWRRSV